MPCHLLAQAPADQRRNDHRDLDAEHVELEGVCPPHVTLLVEVADLGGDVALEAADADEQAGQGDQEADVESHQEVAERHQERAQRHRLGAAEHPVGEEAAEDRGQINRGRVDPEDLRGQGDGAEMAEHPL